MLMIWLYFKCFNPQTIVQSPLVVTTALRDVQGEEELAKCTVLKLEERMAPSQAAPVTRRKTQLGLLCVLAGSIETP